MSIELRELSTRALLGVFVAALAELRDRGVTRSTNNPIADYAERLFERALQLQLATKSTKGYDAPDGTGQKYEIKGRRITAHNKSRQLSSLRGLDQKHFTFLAGVLFNEDFSVLRACLIPHEQVLLVSKYNPHTNGWIFHLRDSVWTLPGAIDVTAKLQEAGKLYA
jgi:hypothetical protein